MKARMPAHSTRMKGMYQVLLSFQVVPNPDATTETNYPILELIIHLYSVASTKTSEPSLSICIVEITCLNCFKPCRPTDSDSHQRIADWFLFMMTTRQSIRGAVAKPLFVLNDELKTQ
jgi:hypothetical protein